ncbi:MAG: hypothetical protein ACT4P7_01205 [Gemmatimonadaceae bacterium]
MTDHIAGERPQGTFAGGRIESSPPPSSSDAGAKRGERVADQVRDFAGQEFDQKKRRTSETLSAFAGALRQTGNESGDETSRLMQRASVQVQRLSEYLDDTDFEHLARQAEDLARRRPIMFLSSAFLVGLAAARLLKSRREQPRSRGDRPARSSWSDPDADSDREQHSSFSG